MTEKTSAITKVFAAQITCIGGSSIFYPLDTIRRRMMMQSGEKQKVYANTVDCFRKIRIEEGFKGYYKGFGTNTIRLFGSSLVLVIYDEIHKILKINQRK